MSDKRCPGELVIASDKDEHAALAGELLAQAIWSAVRERGLARVALSGGTTPAGAYRYLSALSLPWDRIAWFWVDERAVPADSPRSNYAAAYRDLNLGRPEILPSMVFRMEGDAASLDGAADHYEHALREIFGIASAVSFDAMTLGVGDDGHTASLFPGMGVVGVKDRLVTAVEAQPNKNLEARITLTAPVLCEARLLVVTAVGAGKRRAIADAWSKGAEEEVPARLIQRAKGRAVWVLDRDALGEG